MQFLWKYIEDLAGKGLQASVIAELMFYVSSSLVPMALPLALLLASLMTMGNLGENYELTAMKASGISLPRIVAPLILISFFLAIFAFLFSNYVLPFTNKKMTSLLWDITNSKPELQIKEGIFYNGLEGYSIRINSKDYKTKLLHQIKIYKHSSGNGNSDVTVADSGRMEMTPDKKFLFVTLYNGYNYSEAEPPDNKRYNNRNTYPFRRDKFAKQEIRIPMIGFDFKKTDENLFSNNQRMLGLKKLTLYKDSLKKELNAQYTLLYRSLLSSNMMRYKPQNFSNRQDTTLKKKVVKTSFESAYNRLSSSEKNSIINEALNMARESKSTLTNTTFQNEEKTFRMHKYEIEWWRKFTLSAGCMIFFFIGAPLGAIIRKGGLGMPVVISVLFFVLYYVISITGEKFAREGIMSAFMGMWLSGLVLLPTGIFLTRKATKDSGLFNADNYLNFFKRFFRLFTKKNPKVATQL
jgi:lipopolysaccharide export system permease protein